MMDSSFIKWWMCETLHKMGYSCDKFPVYVDTPKVSFTAYEDGWRDYKWKI